MAEDTPARIRVPLPPPDRPSKRADASGGAQAISTGSGIRAPKAARQAGSGRGGEVSDKETIRPSLEREWGYHEADAGRAACRLVRFCSGDAQIMANYLHANGNPTIEGLAIYAERCWATVGGRPDFDKLEAGEVAK